MSFTQYHTNHLTCAKALGNQVLGDKKGKLTGLKYIKQLINSEDITSQTDNQIGNLCSDFHCCIICHTFSKMHNFLISYPILLKFVLLCFSCISASIKSTLFLEWTKSSSLARSLFLFCL